jgi:hypothetical protein
MGAVGVLIFSSAQIKADGSLPDFRGQLYMDSIFVDFHQFSEK